MNKRLKQMQAKKFEQLWSFQTEGRFKELLCDGFLYGGWRQAIYTHDREAAYLFMTSEMSARGVNCGENAPMWAWHSCGGYQRPLGAEVVRLLLSDHEITSHKFVLFSFEVPVSQFVLSDYYIWCEHYYFPPLLDNDTVQDSPESNEEEIKRKLFNINHHHLNSESLIQATLPVIRKKHLLTASRVLLDDNDRIKIISY